MWEFFKDYFGTAEAQSRCSGVLFAFPGRIQEGKDEVRRLARKSKVALTIKNKEVRGRDVDIYWECTGAKSAVKLFTDLVSVSDCFRTISLRAPDSGAADGRRV